MRIGTSLNLAATGREGGVNDATERLRLCAGAGFTLAEADFYMSARGDDLLLGEDWQRRVSALGDAAAKYGVTIEYSHAPFIRGLLTPGQVPDAEDRARFDELMRRSVIASSMLGVKWMTVHPVDDFLNGEYERDVNRKSNIEYLAPTYAALSSRGVGMAVEMLSSLSVEGGRRRYCDCTDDLCDLVDAFALGGADAGVGVAWDTGHAHFNISDQPRALAALGPRLALIEVNDNYGFVDSHLPPFVGGSVKWEAIMPALAAMGYRGDIILDAPAYMADFPRSLMPDGAAFAHNVMLRLRDMFDGRI